jgi:endonuclease/exonuclease/phosphatase family metal-dependent hydrolase
VTENQTDHITVSRRFRKSIEDMRNKRGADIGSDHHSIVAHFRIKTKQTRKNGKKPRRDMM